MPEVSLKELSDRATPGEWTVVPEIDGTTDLTRIKIDGRTLARTSPMFSRPHVERNVSNAALIVALVNAYRRGELHDDTALASAEARARREALEEAGWQPISTYPKNSHPHLVWDLLLGQCVAFIDVTGQWWPVPATDPLSLVPSHWKPLGGSPLTAATAAEPRQTETGWRPIAVAPKGRDADGKMPIILLIAQYPSGTGHWTDVRQGWWDDLLERWERWTHVFPPTHFRIVAPPAPALGSVGGER